jgi:hypothetical protein
MEKDLNGRSGGLLSFFEGIRALRTKGAAFINKPGGLIDPSDSRSRFLVSCWPVREQSTVAGTGDGWGRLPG